MAESMLPFMRDLFRDYAALTLPLLGAAPAEGKADGSSVTRADREGSALVLARLNAHTPQHGVISEEESAAYLPGARSQWAVDPLDGTASLCEGGLALLNGEPMPTREGQLLPDTLNIMITAIHEYVDVRRAEGCRLHNLGSTLYHLMMLAAGRCEVVVAGPCYLWDIAPALPFTRGLGFVERYLDGSPLDLHALMTPDFGFPVKQPLLVGPASLVEPLLRAFA